MKPNTTHNLKMLIVFTVVWAVLAFLILSQLFWIPPLAWITFALVQTQFKGSLNLRSALSFLTALPYPIYFSIYYANSENPDAVGQAIMQWVWIQFLIYICIAQIWGLKNKALNKSINVEPQQAVADERTARPL